MSWTTATRTGFSVILFFLGVTTFSQGTSGFGQGSIESQFNYVIYQSDRQEDLRIMKSWWLYRLKREVTDTLSLKNLTIEELEANVAQKEQKIDSLIQSLESVKGNLQKTKKTKDSITFFGTLLDKSVYKTIMWSTILVLALALAIIILLFNRSNASFRLAKKDLGELKDEFENYRKKALLREQEVVHDLYEELKKYKKKAGE